MNAKARQRAEVIFKVRSGQMTAKAAAQTLGISRQQYYQWEQRGVLQTASGGSKFLRHDNSPGRLASAAE